MYRKVLLNWMAFGNVLFHCFDHEIVLEGVKEEISQQRCTIGAHGYTNNLPENRVSKTNVDVVDKIVNSETKLSTRDAQGSNLIIAF